MNRETRNTLTRLSHDERLSLEFRIACRQDLGDTVEFAGVASFVKPDAAR